ncbi:calpain-type cysteine protease DEK1-like [Capsicum annuum]
MVEDAVHFLSKGTMVQAIARSATKTRNALSGTYSAPQRSASSAALLVGDPTMMRDRGGNFVLPRADVMKLRDRLRNEELAAGSIFSRLRNRTLRHEATSDVGHRREMCAHARILALEEAIDTEWVYMWDKFGGYLLLLLGLTAKAERVQDEVRLRLFLDNIGFSDLSAKDIKKWLPEDRRRFEIIQESYMREKEMEEEILMQRREEEGRGKERRKALLEKEERKWKEIEASLISSFPNAGNREAAAMAAAVRAVGGDSVLDDSFARERVSSIARRIRAAQLSRRTLQEGVLKKDQF